MLLLRSMTLNRGLGGCRLLDNIFIGHIFQSNWHLFLPNVRMVSVPLKTLQKHLDQECSTRQKYLTNVLMCSKKETFEFFQNNPHLVRMSRDKFTKMIDLFAANSITGQDVLSYPQIFKRKYETLKVRFEGLKQNTNLKCIQLSMVNLSQKEFSRRYQMCNEDSTAQDEFHNKCRLLMKYLCCSETDAASFIKTSIWLENSKLSTIQKKLELYISMHPQFSLILMKRIWLLTFPVSVIETKLNDLKRLDIPRFIWQKSLNQLMTTSDKEYDALLQKIVNECSIYDGCISKEEYLCKQLECDKSSLELMIKKYPQLLSVNIVKLENHLNMLRKEFRFTNADIIANSPVFKYSEETLRLKFHELQTYESTLPNLSNMIKNGKKYVAYIEKLKRSSL